MSENLIYADLNLTESNRSRLQKDINIQGRSICLHWALFYSTSLTFILKEGSTKAPKGVMEI